MKAAPLASALTKELLDTTIFLGLEIGAENERLKAANAELAAALSRMMGLAEATTCQHQSTHRGGAIWEICDDCGVKWADDRGGKPKWTEPAEWVDSRAALAKHNEVKS